MGRGLTTAVILSIGVLYAGYARADESGAASTTNWTGPYIGASIGGVFTSVETRPLFDPSLISLSGNKLSLSSLSGGISTGYDHQFGPLVLGVLGDVNITSLHKKN
jgi:hypothetical protein